MNTHEKRLDAVHAITTCYEDRPVLWELHEEDTPQECTDAARELKKLADALRAGRRTPTLNPLLLGISRSARIFVTGGRFNRAYIADPKLFMMQRRALKEALAAIFKEMSDVAGTGAEGWEAEA